MNDNLDALRELRRGIAHWWIDTNDALNGHGRSDLTALAGVGEELTRQAWTIRDQHTPETLTHRIDRLHTERQDTIAARRATT